MADCLKDIKKAAKCSLVDTPEIKNKYIK